MILQVEKVGKRKKVWIFIWFWHLEIYFVFTSLFGVLGIQIEVTALIAQGFLFNFLFGMSLKFGTFRVLFLLNTLVMLRLPFLLSFYCSLILFNSGSLFCFRLRS